MDVAILGGAGLVGQVFIKMLEGHPLFNVTVVTGFKSAGKVYGEYVDWKIWGDIPSYIYSYKIEPTELNRLKDVDLVFSALPSDEAHKIEPLLMKKGFKVISNASAMRMESYVPLVIPEVNPDHLDLIKRRLDKGFIVTNPNCSTIVLSLFLKPLWDVYGFEEVDVVTMQAISGAGYPGHAALDIYNNVIPYIPNEEFKLENETRKVMGSLSEDMIIPADFRVIAQANRVPVIYGHTESVLIRLKSNPKDVDEVFSVLSDFEADPQRMNLYTAPKKPIYVYNGSRPQPRLDSFREGGMAITVGRLRLYKNKVLTAVIHGNNLVRGAAGGTILLGEYMLASSRA